MASDLAKVQATFRKKKRAQGFVSVQSWVLPEDRQKVHAYVKKLNEKAEREGRVKDV